MTKTKKKPATPPPPAPDAPPRGRGRPTLYTREIADEICRRMGEGEYLARICAEEGMPPKSTVIGWHLEDRDGFSVRYTRARHAQAEAMLEETLEIADDSSRDMTTDDEGRAVVDHEHIQRSKLRVDTRKWAMAKVYPRVYGDKVQVEGEIRVPLAIIHRLPDHDPLVPKPDEERVLDVNPTPARRALKGRTT